MKEMDFKEGDTVEVVFLPNQLGVRVLNFEVPISSVCSHSKREIVLWISMSPISKNPNIYLRYDKESGVWTFCMSEDCRGILVDVKKTDLYNYNPDPLKDLTI